MQFVNTLLLAAACAAALVALVATPTWALPTPAWPGFGWAVPNSQLPISSILMYGDNGSKNGHVKRELADKQGSAKPKRIRRPLAEIKAEQQRAYSANAAAVPMAKQKSPMRLESDPELDFGNDFVDNSNNNNNNNNPQQQQSQKPQEPQEPQFTYANVDCAELGPTLNKVLGLGLTSLDVRDKCQLFSTEHDVITSVKPDDLGVSYTVRGTEVSVRQDYESISFSCAGFRGANPRVIRLDKDASDAQIDCGVSDGADSAVRFIGVKVRPVHPDGGLQRHRDRIFDITVKSSGGESKLDMIGEIYTFHGVNGVRVSFADQLVDVRQSNVISIGSSRGLAYVSDISPGKESFELSMISRK